MRYKGIEHTPYPNATMENTRAINEGDQGEGLNDLRIKLESAYSAEERKIKQVVAIYEEYITYMVNHHPCSASDIAEAVGPSKKAVHEILKRLRNYDIVVRINFEHHTLYVLNGHLNRYFPKVERVG